MAYTNSVDMMATAKDAQFEAASFMGQGTIKLLAPAKVNLFLAVGARRADGYHDVTNIMHTLLLHDVVYMNSIPATADEIAEITAEGSTHIAAGPSQNIAVRIEISDKTCALGGEGLQVNTADNLAYAAVDALARATNHERPQKVEIRIEKQIPAQAGLGGGSSDAAAALVGAAHFWGINATDPVLTQAASQVGADVAFFLQGGCAEFTGVGEHHERSLTPMKAPVVLVKPPTGVSTAAAYAAFDADPQLVTADMQRVANAATEAEDVPLFNNLHAAAFALNEDIAQATDFLKSQPELDPQKVLMSGSGSAVFAIAPDFATATNISARAQQQGLWSRATTFANLRACH
jgi:4-diphosphocytidyl-2-C-methyl-D-erythritol kinase